MQGTISHGAASGSDAEELQIPLAIPLVVSV